MYVAQKNSQSQDVGVKVEQVIDSISDWKVYRNEEYGFEIKYPPLFSLIKPGKDRYTRGSEIFLIELLPPSSLQYVISIRIYPFYTPKNQVIDPESEYFPQLIKLRYINGIQWKEVCCHPGLYSNTSLWAGHKSLTFRVSLDAESNAASNFHNLDSTDSEIILIFRKIMETFRFF